MNGNDQKNHENQPLGDLPVQKDKLAFEADEMQICGQCSRTNPPTRLKCFYCAAELENAGKQTASRKLILRKPEIWEKGFSLICRKHAAEKPVYERIAKIAALDIETTEKIVESRFPLPILRTESIAEASAAAEILVDCGLPTKIVSDESLQPEMPVRRLRGLEFEGDKLILIDFNTSEISEIRREDLNLIVTGAIFERKTEAIEKRKKNSVEILESMNFASDEQLIDIYSRRDSVGCRILTKGFDFSNLESEKGILAAENLKKLTAKLQNFAPDAKIIDDYLSIREILGKVWEIELRKDAKGMKRHSFSKFDFANVESSSNLQQFTKYSRLQRQIL